MSRKPTSIEQTTERVIFASRWLQAPMYLVMLLILFAFVYFAFADVYSLFRHLGSITEEDLIITSLTLADLILIANLIVIIVISGYENFVSRLDLEHQEGEPTWLKKISPTGVKIKIAASIVAISSIQLLKVYFETSTHAKAIDTRLLQWTVIIHITFILSALLLTVMSWVEKRI
ncbi:TIGR00645 family protein [Dongshaea marina]|uniref:TIGR00645 family protein n=1 Tax=Dongshaea marina TaxID=2047966 RepID=UPI000D3E6F6B|nr:TIGR00645 family protein [Dongshaea marina]